MNSKIQHLLKLANDENEYSSVNFAKYVFPHQTGASGAFTKLKRKLANINEWNEHSAISSYQTFDEHADVRPHPLITEGVFIRINLKGSGKYDWVKVIEIHESADELVITVKPTYDPTAQPPDKTQTSHFFTSESTNNFCLLKHENSVSLYVVGLQEKQNTAETSGALETVRNVATAKLGAYFGVQKTEWKTFCQRFLDSVI